MLSGLVLGLNFLSVFPLFPHLRWPSRCPAWRWAVETPQWPPSTNQEVPEPCQRHGRQLRQRRPARPSALSCGSEAQQSWRWGGGVPLFQINQIAEQKMEETHNNKGGDGRRNSAPPLHTWHTFTTVPWLKKTTGGRSLSFSLPLSVIYFLLVVVVVWRRVQLKR